VTSPAAVVAATATAAPVDAADATPSPADGFERRWAVRGLMAVNRVFAVGYHHCRVLRPCPLPRAGPVILAVNHLSGIDPCFMQATCPRPIVWMMDRAFIDLPLARWVFRVAETIPVDTKGRDTNSVRLALRALERGRLLGVFPEGRLARGRGLMPFQNGVAMLAKRSGVKIWPAAIEGSQRGHSHARAYGEPQDAAVAYGDPIEPGRDLEAVTRRLQATVEGLLREIGTPAGEPQRP